MGFLSKPSGGGNNGNVDSGAILADGFSGGVAHEAVFQSKVDTVFNSAVTSLFKIDVVGDAYMEEIIFPNLLTVTDSISIRTMEVLTSVSMPALTTTPQLALSSSDLVETVDISSLTTSDSISIVSNNLLTDISVNPTIDCLSVEFYGNALTQACVDNILAAFDAASTSNGSLNLASGTNAAPTDGASNTNKLSLESRGWTVSVNA